MSPKLNDKHKQFIAIIAKRYNEGSLSASQAVFLYHDYADIHWPIPSKGTNRYQFFVEADSLTDLFNWRD